MKCPACGSESKPTFVKDVLMCRNVTCRGVFSEVPIPYAVYHSIVGLDWAKGVRLEDSRYFDFKVAYSDGQRENGRNFERYHGWYDPITHGITQVG